MGTAAKSRKRFRKLTKKVDTPLEMATSKMGPGAKRIKYKQNLSDEVAKRLKGKGNSGAVMGAYRNMKKYETKTAEAKAKKKAADKAKADAKARVKPKAMGTTSNRTPSAAKGKKHIPVSRAKVTLIAEPTKPSKAKVTLLATPKKKKKKK